EISVSFSNRLVESIRGDLVMRSIPYFVSVSNQNNLWGLVLDLQPRGRLVGDLSRRLHGDQFIGGFGVCARQMRRKLGKRSGADRTSQAVLEDEHRALIRFLERLVQLPDAIKVFQINGHFERLTARLIFAAQTSARNRYIRRNDRRRERVAINPVGSEGDH